MRKLYFTLYAISYPNLFFVLYFSHFRNHITFNLSIIFYHIILRKNGHKKIQKEKINMTSLIHNKRFSK